MAQKRSYWAGAREVDSQWLVIALFRCWLGERAKGREPMPAMMRLVEGYGYDLTLVPICDSFFALTESCVGRPLEGGADEDEPALLLSEPEQDYASDELGLLAMLRECQSIDPTQTSPAIPHGLPGALCWASRALLRVLGPNAAATMGKEKARCPFVAAAKRPIFWASAMPLGSL